MSGSNPNGLSPLAATVQDGGFGASMRTVARTLAFGAGSVTNPWMTPTLRTSNAGRDRDDSVAFVRPWMMHGMNDSFRFVARQAVSTEPDSVRSIIGRIGGRFDRSRSVDGSGIELEPSEGTRLMPPDEEKRVDEAGGPPLAQWIVPALSCALAYAFYNVSIFH